MSSVGDVLSSEPTPVPFKLAEPDETETAFKDSMEHVLKAFDSEVLEPYGGPAQYLQHKLADPSEQTAFLQWLWGTFPLQEDKLYNLENPMPSAEESQLGDQAPCKAHISMLGYMALCTLKPMPSAHSARLLVQHLLMDGFVTSSQPLQIKHVTPDVLLTAPWAAAANGLPIHPFSLGYVKGMLRGSTILALLYMFWQDGQGLQLLETFSNLRTSCGVVYVHHIKHFSLQDEVFYNFRVSLRGSIRRPPNLPTWVGTLSQLKQKGYEDSAAVISRFNSGVGKSFQLVGSKATAIGNLMSLFPADLLTLLQAHVSKYGWDSCVLSDDNLSAKKILPNYVHKSPHKSWKKLAAMSVVSTTLTFRRLTRDFDKMSPHARRKADKATMESFAELAALVVNLSKQLAELFPLKQADLETEIYDKWVEGSPGLDLELHEVCTEKRESLVVTDIKAFRAVADLLQCKIPVPKNSEEIQLTELAASKFELLKKQLDYDQTAFKVHQSKIQSYEHAVHHAKLEWKQKLRSEAAQWCNSWLAKKCKVFTYDPSQTGALTKLVSDHAQTLIKGAGLSKPAVAAQLHVNLSCYLVVLLLKAFLNPCCGFPCSSKATLSVLNWSAPAVHSQLAQEAQACCFAHTVSESFCNLGVLLCPVFHYKKHQMHVLEHFLLKSLACRGVDVDLQASLMFKDRKDSRDTRPLVYPIRIIRPYIEAVQSDDEAEDDQRTSRSKRNPAGRYWQASQLVRTRRTEEADQVPATKLKVVEDLSDAAVPFSTDLDGSVRGGRRFEQIGPSASCKLLESLLENDLPGNISGLLVLDLSLGVGDLFWAWLERVKAMKFPILYVAASADPTAVEWVQHTIQEELTEKLLSGDVVLPGFHVRPKDAPAEVLASAPPPPQLNVCVLQQGVLAVPQVVVQQWAAHPTFGTEFQQLLADHIAEFGEAPPEKAGSSGQANSCPEPSPKKRRTTAPLKSELVDNLPAVKHAQAAVVGLKKELLGKIMIRVSTDRSWLLVNVSQNVVALPAGTVLAGFGPGTFKHVPRLAEGKLGPADVEKHILFDMKNANTHVLHNGKLTTLGEIVNAVQGNRAATDICYHSQKPAPSEDPKHFELERKHEVYYCPASKTNAQVEASGDDPTNLELKGSSSLASLVPLSTCKFEHCSIMWAVKWATKGLMPIKPQVALTYDVEIQPGTAVHL